MERNVKLLMMAKVLKVWLLLSPKHLLLHVSLGLLAPQVRILLLLIVLSILLLSVLRIVSLVVKLHRVMLLGSRGRSLKVLLRILAVRRHLGRKWHVGYLCLILLVLVVSFLRSILEGLILVLSLMAHALINNFKSRRRHTGV